MITGRTLELARRASAPVGLALGVLLAATAAGQLHSPFARIPHSVVAFSVFLCLLAGIAACLDLRLVDWQHDWLQLLALLTTVAGVFVACRTGLVGSPGTPFVLIGVVAYGAWIEELVFRRLLPRAFVRALRSAGGPRATTVGVVASQLLFAATHFLPGLQNQEMGLAALLRLFTGGLLLAAVVSRAGLAIGAMLHAELNLAAILPQPPPGMPSIRGVGLIAALAIGITLTDLTPFLTISNSRNAR